MSYLELNIRDIIQNRSVVTCFQPLVSIKKRSLFGFEALSRGVVDQTNLFIPPGILFSLADQNNARLELDRLCRNRALESFSEIHAKDRQLMLSLNLDTSLLESGVVGSNHLLRQVHEFGINPNNVIIELIESNVRDEGALLSFINNYRQAGFLIALDDVGAGHSNLERIATTKPDVIKVDRSLVRDVDKELYKLEVTKALVGMAHKIGAMVVAEGVESKDEAIALLELGVDVFQGFYFARPFLPQERDYGFLERTSYVAATFRDHVLGKINNRRKMLENYARLQEAIILALSGCSYKEFDQKLAECIAMHPDLECLYVLNDRGMQVTNTLCNPYKLSENKRFLYQPAQKGSDHSLKDFYLPIRAGLPTACTDSYISLASGNLCTTMSASFTSKDGKPFILCMDIGRDPHCELCATI